MLHEARILESPRAVPDAIDGEVIQIEEMVRLLSFYDLDDNALMFFQMLEGND